MLHTDALYDLVGTMLHAAGITRLKIMFVTLYVIQTHGTLTTRDP
jgi:hypothetical protein